MGQLTLLVCGIRDQLLDIIHVDDCVDGVLTTNDGTDDGNAWNLS
jgi:nucleoside-diphosphate-sugar epimerase